jgi:hypothetical protein
MRDMLSRTEHLNFCLDRIGRLKIYLDRIGIGLVALIFFWIGSVDSKKIGSGSDRLTQKKLDRFGIGS